MLCEWTTQMLTIALLLGVGGLATSSRCDAADAKNREWKVTVSATRDARGDWQLDIAMQYQGAKAKELPYTQIPWKWPYAIKVCAVPADGLVPAQLSPSIPAIDPPTGKLIVKSKETLKGTCTPFDLFPAP